MWMDQCPADGVLLPDYRTTDLTLLTAAWSTDTETTQHLLTEALINALTTGNAAAPALTDPASLTA